ncbi:MAG: serine/threonine-protein kinase [Planctomycetaceae bacterium]
MDDLHFSQDSSDDPDSIIDLQQHRWRNGDRVSVEALIAEQPAVAARQDLMMDLVYGEVLLREARGESPAPEEYIRRFPQLQAEIARQFQIHRALEISVGDASTADPDATLTGTPPSLPSRAPRIPGFELERIVGRGGNGVVYRATEERLNRPVAVKLLMNVDAAGEQQRSSLFREAEAAASLRHPGIVPVYQVGEFDGAAFLVMEFCDGGSLAERLRNGPLPVSDAVALMKQVALAVQFAHSRGTIHRDLKPGNVLLDRHGQPQVSDFGLARRLDAEHTLRATGDVVGTPAYMAPEQARGETADERSDVYSLGAVLYETLCGRPPFQAATPWEIVSQVLTNDPPLLRELNSSVPVELETICARCLEKDAARRYASAQELAEELVRFEKGEPILARPVSQFQRFRKWCGRNRRVASLAAVSLTLLLALGIGSTIAAFWLSSANNSVRQERTKAQQAELAADQDRTAAVNALNSLVESLYDDLSANAATIRTREKIVDAAIDGLNSLSQVRGDRAADRTTLRALHRIGDLMSLKGSHDEAAQSFQRAIDLAREVLERHPDDPEPKLDLAASLGRFSVHYTRLTKPALAEAFANESFSLLNEVLADDPDNQQALRQIVVQHQQKLDSMWQAMASPAQVIEAGNQAILHIDRLNALAPDDTVAQRSGQMIHFQIGRAFLDSGDAATAGKHFTIARQLVDRLLETQQHNTDLRSSAALLDRAQGMVSTALGNPDRAAELFEQSLLTFRELSAADPQNSQARRNIANTESLMADTLHALQRDEESMHYLQEAIEIYDAMIRDEPQNNSNRILIAEALLKMSNAHLAGDHWEQSAEDCRQMLHYLHADESGESTTGGAAAMYSLLATLLLESTERLLGNSADSKTTTGECIALMLAARRDAQAATSDVLSEEARNVIRNVNPDVTANTFEELFDHINGLQDVNPMFSGYRLIYHAGTHAFRAQNLVESDSEVNRETAAIHVAEAIALLKKLATENPPSLQFILSDPDLTWLRSTSEWSTTNFLPAN